ncbi:hypothetical protein AgCh_018302 [Apium graveolens]
MVLGPRNGTSGFMVPIMEQKIPRRFFSGSRGRVPVPSVSGSSEVVVLDPSGPVGRNNSSINVKDISQENEHTRYSPLVYARDVAKKKEEIMRIPRRFFSGSRGRVPVPSVSGSSEMCAGAPASAPHHPFHPSKCFQHLTLPYRIALDSIQHLP